MNKFRCLPRLCRGIADIPRFTPEDTEYFDVSLADREAFGEPRVESTRLQAAARRIAEHFMVYDAMDQTLLEHEAQLDFGGGESTAAAGGVGPSIVDVDNSELGKLDRDNVSNVRQYLFNSYTLQSRGQLSDFIENLERMPVQGQLPPAEVQAKLDQLLRKSQPNFLSEIASVLAVRGVPNLGALNRMMQTLLDRGYYQPCQVVLDSLLMSRTPLNMQTLAIALALATLAGKRNVFYSYALLPEASPDSRFGDLSLPSEELIDSLAFGYAKFQDKDNLDRTLRWGEECKVLGARALRTNMRAAVFWSDSVRAKWTLEKLQKMGKVPRYIVDMARKVDESLGT